LLLPDVMDWCRLSMVPCTTRSCHIEHFNQQSENNQQFYWADSRDRNEFIIHAAFAVQKHNRTADVW
jgi:hypothetical protein